MSEHNHASHHEHNYENCCDNHTPDNHGCGCCGEDHFNEHKKETLTKIIISAVFFAAGYIISEFTELPSYVYLVCYLISYLMVGFDIVRDAADSVIHGRFFDENFLMSFASIGAFAIKEYTEGVAVVLLFTVGEFIQGLAVSKSRKSIDEIFAQKHKTYTLPRHYDNEESHTEQMITKFARIYTPAICIIAIAVVVIPPIFLKAEWHEWLHRGLADPSKKGCQVINTIKSVADDLVMYEKIGAIVNRMADESLKDYIDTNGIEVLSYIGDDKNLSMFDIQGENIFNLPEESNVVVGVKQALEKIEVL